MKSYIEIDFMIMKTLSEMTTKWNKKFYVVRKWKKNWIFDSREKCKECVNWYSDAKYKSFSNLADAETALNEWREKYYNSDSRKTEKIDKNQIYKTVPFFKASIAVDAACSWNPWILEYRWVDLQTWNEIFHEKFELWTNNIGEFLAIVHWLEYLEWNEEKVIYSDSRNAIARVQNKKCKTQFDFNQYERLKWAIMDAENWIKKHWIKNRILKWDTDEWWEIPADFGRK